MSDLSETERGRNKKKDLTLRSMGCAGVKRETETETERQRESKQYRDERNDRETKERRDREKKVIERERKECR